MMRKKDAIELGITAVLAVLFLLASFSLVGRMKGRRSVSPSASAPTITGTPFTVKGEIRGRVLNRKKVKEDRFFARFITATEALPSGRDPFAAGSEAPKADRADLMLGGIMWNEQKPVAIINQTFVSEGDTINSYKVVKIEPAKVVLNDGEKDIEIFLNQNA